MSTDGPGGTELICAICFSKRFGDNENSHLNAVKEKQPIWCRISAPRTLLALFRTCFLVGAMPKKSHLVKDIVSEQKTPRYLAVAFVLLFRPKKVSGIQYGVFSGRDMNRISVVEVNATSAWGKSVMNSDIFNPINREPTPNGVLDRHLGISSKAEVCQTCGKNIATCPGHFGTIHLVMPVFHIGFINMIVNMLRCICKVRVGYFISPRNARAVC